MIPALDVAVTGAAADRSVSRCPESQSLQNERHKRELIIQAIPNLRAFAASLTGNRVSADDLVQETLVRAIASLGTFQLGTNMGAWLFTIQRNLFFSEYRKERRLPEYYRSMEGLQSSVSHPSQFSYLELQDLRKALAALPDEQREAIILVGASGLSYDEAATICGCAAGTVKSRVSRARARLCQLLDPDSSENAGVDADALFALS